MNLENVVLILRSVSGAGKSTYANYLKSLFDKDYERDCVICCADDYFIDKTGKYSFEPSLLTYAHEHCKGKFISALENKTNLIIVANTNASEKEFDFYIDKAKSAGYVVFCMVVENRNNTKNIHGVSEQVLERQQARIENSLKLK